MKLHIFSDKTEDVETAKFESEKVRSKLYCFCMVPIGEKKKSISLFVIGFAGTTNEVKETFGFENAEAFCMGLDHIKFSYQNVKMLLLTNIVL